MLAPGPSPAALSGYIDLAAVQSETDGQRQESLRQDYIANWTRNLLPDLNARASFRYYRFALDQPQADNFWQEDIQPSGELAWRAPWFHLNASGRRRGTESQTTATRLLNDNYAVFLRSTQPGIPVVSFRADLDRLHDQGADAGRDTRERRYLAAADHNFGRLNLNFDLSLRRSENRISGVESDAIRHLARTTLSPISLGSDRLRLSGSYAFTHLNETDRRLDADRLLGEVPVAGGLYADDATPDLGALQPIQGLVDGVTGSPTDPLVDIGGSLPDWNLGADLGFRRPVTGFYLYTDRPSGAGVGWDVYTSDDNLNWTAWDLAPRSLFNTALSRYEMTFAPVETRYVKVVKSGLNEVSEVFVTEVTVLEEISRDEEAKRRQRTHLADLNATWQAAARLLAGLGAGFQQQPAGGRSGDRRLFYYSLLATWGRGGRVVQDFRWRQEFEQPESGAGAERRVRSASYTVVYDPLSALGLTAGGSTRLEEEEARDLQGTRTAFIQARGAPLPEADFSAEVSRSRNELHQSGRRNDVWTVRAGGTAGLLPALDLTADWTRQSIRTLPEDTLRTRSTYGAGASLRLSGSILLRGAVSMVDDIKDALGHDYTLSWTVTPKLSLAGQASFDWAQGGRETERFGASATYDISRRITLHFSATRNDFTEVGGSRTTTLQQGVRATI